MDFPVPYQDPWVLSPTSKPLTVDRLRNRSRLWTSVGDQWVVPLLVPFFLRKEREQDGRMKIPMENTGVRLISISCSPDNYVRYLRSKTLCLVSPLLPCPLDLPSRCRILPPADTVHLCPGQSIYFVSPMESKVVHRPSYRCFLCPST